jgi:hypothetical protein
MDRRYKEIEMALTITDTMLRMAEDAMTQGDFEYTMGGRVNILRSHAIGNL